MSASRNYVLNKNFREPYIHYTKEGYAETPSSPEAMEKSAFDIYKKQSTSLMRTFAKNELGEGSSVKQAREAVKTVESALNAIQNSNQFKAETENINVFKDELYKINGRSFWSYSGKPARRDELFNDVEAFSKYVEALGASLEAFRKTSQLERESIMNALENKRLNIPSTAALSDLKIIKSDKKADAGLKKLIASVELLQRYADPLSMKYSHLAQTPNISEEDAREIVRTIGGSLNGLKGGFFEVAVNDLIAQMRGDLVSSIEQAVGDKAKLTGVEMAGQTSVKSKVTGKKVVSKSDLNVGMTFGKDHSKMTIGLSLKTATPDKDGYRTTRLVGRANLGDLLNRAGTLIDESTYHLANIIAGNGSTSGAVYRAAKTRASALLSIQALSGLGEKSDTAYFVMYTDKIVNISSYLSEISKRKQLPLSASLSGVESVKNTIQSRRESYDYVEMYNRSRESLRLILSSVKVSIDSKTKG